MTYLSYNLNYIFIFIVIYAYGHSLSGTFSVSNSRSQSLYRSQGPKRPSHRRRRRLCRFSHILRPALLLTGRCRHGSHAQPRKGKPLRWLKISAQDVEESICKFAKKGLMPSQIGAILRDSHGIAQVKSVTGSKMLSILKAHGFAPDTPEDLYHLI